MPLKCVTPEGETLLAFDYDAATWRSLAESNRRDPRLSMACCGRRAILKTSQCDTRFFAHAPRDGSACPRESEEHLQAKDLIARAVVQANWRADTEALLSPHKLVADVLATKGARRVAFEVQWSRQKWDDTLSRHLAYEKAGVRTLWLFKQSEYPLSNDIPAFRLVRAEDRRTFHVWVWHEEHAFAKATEPSQVAELQDFIAGAVSGRLKWMPALGLAVPVIGRMGSVRCRKGHDTRVLADLELDIGRVLPGHANPRLPVSVFSEHPEFLRTEPARALLAENELALNFGVSNLKLGRAPDNFHRYALTCCSKCGTIVGEWELKDEERQRLPAFESALELSSRLMKSIPGLKRALQRWWLDTRPSSP